MEFSVGSDSVLVEPNYGSSSAEGSDILASSWEYLDQDLVREGMQIARSMVFGWLVGWFYC